ncbi:MAG: hypothetical protein A3C80_02255 [Candidatus Ryanbacteria bacterium RIFCSPHIGHO2_02_FULL_45_43]|uniref:Uncharacterized protein n=1 Tax=Candidatus Ryanbacteria bacterium RIFCSPHIGHO2_01_45_13 TaxID=1802112 RepID=A0A1G2FXU1_9BACT|nr:MAG: hypothetical protein A2718_00685 [Candidatus Ryanbacteria bacterium RIFCSPHIGHO2_01_FULL_44_130]OGZ42428.1 MAG: hypothetical protein A2W41_03530 [Candidatus Ryanbacteria bacterium RIFCSPHIGHO2_01_45_13]OGZ48445.1 MAG: hypothetical protein A3C80_02255 [Candidatus Ryanbacteria bacterium RIFCSPHIGHO2_02_FULL_45_43]OGZ50310.1 MAG: hypothetical protein A3E55_00155 [Candidatus Ryanbacteria bacterium RIFCSPHIGHO2_12_FULL_44_20]OGZ51649.1 MAG: hypothetical protein A3A17_02605 [Candidatus Ryanba
MSIRNEIQDALFIIGEIRRNALSIIRHPPTFASSDLSEYKYGETNEQLSCYNGERYCAHCHRDVKVLAIKNNDGSGNSFQCRECFNLLPPSGATRGGMQENRKHV